VDTKKLSHELTAMARPPAIINKTSSGGVVYRVTGKDIDVVLISVKERSVWCLPKGAIDKNESLPEAALREVREETGLTAEILEKIGRISYWYFIKEKMNRIHKTVHFYLMRFISGSTDDHDHEVDEARWISIDEAVSALTYKSEREIMEMAKKMIVEGTG
jgi:8-oxo-dGTP pyrophosphatase MutT (NUDIX family)